MKVLTPVLLIFGMCVMLMSCKSNAKVTSLDNYTKNMIAFSTGGGFTGVETIFTILENGQVFSASGLDPKKTMLFGKLPVKAAKSFLKKQIKSIGRKKLSTTPETYTIHFLSAPMEA
jgi:hypothetical protein